MPDLSDIIEQAAGEPMTATSDGQTAQSHPLRDLIEADKYLTAKSALTGTNANGGPKTAWRRLRMARWKPTGPGPE